MKKKHISLLILFSIFLANFSKAQWSDASKLPLSVCSITNFQSYVYATADTLGNTYYLWTDFRAGSGDLYAQKLDAKGVPQWATNGIKIGNIVGNQSFFYSPKIIKPDNNGGAFITWQQAFDVNNLSRRNLMGQYVSKNGTNQWTSGGIKLTNLELNSADIYDVALDAALENDKILVFFNKRANSDAQELYYRQFNLNGLPVDNEIKIPTGAIAESQVVYDSKNKQYIILSMSANKQDFMVSRFAVFSTNIINSSNVFQNQAGQTSRIDYFKLDKNGSVFIGRTINCKQVFTYKIGVDGKPNWGNDGVTLGSNQSCDLQIAPTSDNGALVSWIETADTQHPFRTAKLDATGKILWQKDIFKAQTGTNYLFPNKFVVDGKDGAYSMWFTQKNIGFDMTLQRIDKDGNLVFGDAGKAITNWTFYSDWKLIPHPKGGVIAYYGANTDKVNTDATTIDLYVNRFKEDGTQGTFNSLVLSDLIKKTYYSGDSVSIKFTATGDGFSANNQFYVKLLDDKGNFSDVTLPVINSAVKLPATLASGNYKFTIYAIDPAISSENQISFSVIKPAFRINDLLKNDFCTGEGFDMSLKIDAAFQADNVFKVLLSDATGNFTNSREIGKNSNNTIAVKIPADAIQGVYKIKVVSSNPSLESANIIDIKIKNISVPKVTASKATACMGVDTVTFTAQGCDGGLITWSNMATGNSVKVFATQTLNFQATCSVVGCSAVGVSETVSVIVNPLPTISVSNSGPYVEGDEIKLSSSGGTIYEWKGPNNFASLLQNPSIAKATIAANGIYFVKITKDNCSKTAQTEVKVSPLLATENNFSKSLKIYPNPSTGSVLVEFKGNFGAELTIYLVDLDGKVYENRKVITNGVNQQEIFDLRNFNNGTYFVRIIGQGIENTKKIIYQN